MHLVSLELRYPVTKCGQTERNILVTMVHGKYLEILDNKMVFLQPNINKAIKFS